MNKTYKTCEVLLSIQDHATLKQFAREHNIGMSGLLYRAIIQYMENEHGIKLTGTATMRNEWLPRKQLHDNKSFKEK